tara:strand:+ start:522 stop:1073 length:552 start_codon:yes stop_codon:yes gene_type:complete
MAQSRFLKDASPMNTMPIPGQSLTDTPKNYPWEKPAKFSRPEKMFQAISKNCMAPKARKDIARLLDVGLTAETLASGMVMNAFTEGYCTPDVSEIIKEPLVRVITRIGLDEGVEEMNIVNELPEPAMSQEDAFDLMEKMNPEKYQRMMDSIPLDEGGDMPEEEEGSMMEENMSEGFINRKESM